MIARLLTILCLSLAFAWPADARPVIRHVGRPPIWIPIRPPLRDAYRPAMGAKP
jgi:hypothetical protein